MEGDVGFGRFMGKLGNLNISDSSEEDSSSEEEEYLSEEEEPSSTISKRKITVIPSIEYIQTREEIPEQRHTRKVIEYARTKEETSRQRYIEKVAKDIKVTEGYSSTINIDGVDYPIKDISEYEGSWLDEERFRNTILNKTTGNPYTKQEMIEGSLEILFGGKYPGASPAEIIKGLQSKKRKPGRKRDSDAEYIIGKAKFAIWNASKRLERNVVSRKPTGKIKYSSKIPSRVKTKEEPKVFRKELFQLDKQRIDELDARLRRRTNEPTYVFALKSKFARKLLQIVDNIEFVVNMCEYFGKKILTGCEFSEEIEAIIDVVLNS